MNWIRIYSQKDLNALLDTFGGFHDACSHEAHIWTQEFVNTDLSMNVPGQRNAAVRMLFQRQWKKPSAIELLFEELVTLHYWPTQDNDDPSIFDATLLLSEGTIYWAGHEGWSPKDSDRDRVTWIAAKKLAWREASDWMGAELRYHANPVFECEREDG
ncbi:hypothetical protein QPK87_19055 [Kamptonema cortianum]|nr:hypothetical protein [Geitlerinema splendidum]MDK3158655.1 hypothetical protein [Kamptonema cortianum]